MLGVVLAAISAMALNGVPAVAASTGGVAMSCEDEASARPAPAASGPDVLGRVVVEDVAAAVAGALSDTAVGFAGEFAPGCSTVSIPEIIRNPVAW